MNKEQEQQDWKKRYDSLQHSFQKLLSDKYRLEEENLKLENRNKQLIISAQTGAMVTQKQFQSQGDEITSMGEEIGRLRTLLREHNIKAD
jgi:hypothetical protein